MLGAVILFGVAAAIVLFFFDHALAVRDRALPEEVGSSPLLEEHCGARVQRGRNFTVPFVRLTLYEEFLVISCLDYRRSVRYEDIEQLDEVKTLLGTGLLLKVRDPDIPVLTLWVRNVARVRAVILRMSSAQHSVV